MQIKRMNLKRRKKKKGRKEEEELKMENSNIDNNFLFPF